MKREKVKFYVERDSFGVEACVIFMALSVAFRIIGCWGLWNDKSYAILQIALPIVSALLLVLCVTLSPGDRWCLPSYRNRWFYSWYRW